MTTTQSHNGHALVLGASITGLMAARVLADHFERVTLVERDTLPGGAQHRGGVPQDRHVHGLLRRGLEIMESYFPGLETELDALGVPRVEWMAETLQLLPTGWTPRYASGIYTRPVTRVLIESVIRKRVLALPNITVISGMIADSLRADGDRVTGACLVPRRGRDQAGQFVAADLVIDATGRTSQAPEWLKALGYTPPHDIVINAHLGYATRIYQLPPTFQPDWNATLILPSVERTRGGVIHHIKGDEWIMTLAGTNGDMPPTDDEGFLAFARSIPAPMLHEAIEQGTPLTPVYGYQKTENRWRAFERMVNRPRGFIAVGDAVCAFNPIYGQGMTIASLGAVVLDKSLSADWGTPEFEARFQRRLAWENQTAWLMTTTEDARFPTTEGFNGRPVMHLIRKFGIVWLDWLFAAAPQSTVVSTALIRTMHLLDRPVSLFSPKLIAHRLTIKI